MAESNYRTTAEQSDLAQDDPFAELTRIMGHDPRTVAPSLKAPASETTDDLALELENELLGDAADEGHAPDYSGAEVISWTRASAPSIPPEPEVDDSFDAMLEQAFDHDEELAGSFDHAQEPETHSAPFSFDERDLSEPESDFAPGPVEELPVYQEFPSEVASYRPDAEAEGSDYPPSHGYEEERAVEQEPEVLFDYARAVAQKPSFSAPAEEAPSYESYADEDESAPEIAKENSPVAHDWDADWLHSSDLNFASSDAAQPIASSDLGQDADPERNWTDETPAYGSSVGKADTADDWLTEALFDEADGSSASRGWHAGDSAEQASPQPQSYHRDTFPPEVDTIEVPESAVALADGLDIPDVPYREQVRPAAELDEIEEILAGAFGESTDGASQPDDGWAETTAPHAAYFEARDEGDDYFTENLSGTAVSGAAAYAARPSAEPYAPQQWNMAGDEFAPAPGVQPPAAGPSRFNTRMLTAAAVVGGVAILGGAAMFALSFGGGESSEPAVVVADTSPIKVKPETPGGIQIPNQDNPVYKRVSGEQANAAPSQESLISTTEEPIRLAPPVEEEPEPEVGAGEGDSQSAKVEERLASVATESDGAGGGVTLSPRRVRSFVVRADGTMVPNDMPEPTAGAEPDVATGTVQPNNATAPTEFEMAAGSDQAAAESEPSAQENATTQEAAAPVVPRTGPIPPSRPANIPVAQAPVQQPAPAAPAQVAAASPEPFSQPAAASEWSVQIASQPTVEGAQQSYQQLAQRYGSVLQGKGVNIVKADIEGKGTYYRVRIPSNSKDAAIELCSKLQSAGGTCFVSK